MPANTLLNVNVPNLPWEKIEGIVATRLGSRHRSEPVIKSADPRGRPIYWVGPCGAAQDAGPGTDFYAVNNHQVSVTPIHIDLTKHSLIDDLSNWYVRRSRKRFWKAEDDADKRTAYRTLYEAIVTITKIIAPILPFMAEAIYRNMTPEEDLEKAESVHLCPYPEADGAAVDRDLIERMEKIRAFAALGHAARNEKGIKVRQPLRTIYLKATEKEWEKLRVLFPLLVEELNIKEVERTEDPEKMDRDRFALFSDEAGRTVLLDTEITDELRKEGIAREFIRKVQILRRETGLNVEDRIELLYKADEPFRSALAAHRDWIAGEILAVKLGEAEPADGWSEVKMEGKKLKVSLKKAS